MKYTNRDHHTYVCEQEHQHTENSGVAALSCGVGNVRTHAAHSLTTVMIQTRSLLRGVLIGFMRPTPLQLMTQNQVSYGVADRDGHVVQRHGRKNVKIRVRWQVVHHRHVGINAGIDCKGREQDRLSLNTSSGARKKDLQEITALTKSRVSDPTSFVKSIGSTKVPACDCWKIPVLGSSRKPSLGLPIGSSRLSVLGLHVALEPLLSKLAVLAAVLVGPAGSDMASAAGTGMGR